MQYSTKHSMNIVCHSINIVYHSVTFLPPKSPDIKFQSGARTREGLETTPIAIRLPCVASVNTAAVLHFRLAATTDTIRDLSRLSDM